MLNGYFMLGGPANVSAPLPLFEEHYSGNHIGARARGDWVIDTDLDHAELIIPARDKRVELLASDLLDFSEEIGGIDSSYSDMTYRDKLLIIQQRLVPSFVGIVNNINVDTHGSLAVIFNEVPVYFTGLHDTQRNISYLLWSDDKSFVSRVLSADPLRYLIYRMPERTNFSIFLQSEAVCSKWWRWIKTHNSVLHAFNALERRMFGEP